MKAPQLTIWKYPLAVEDYVTLSLPKGARILSVQTQRGLPQLWALVDADAPTVQRRFRVFGTGHALPNGVIFDTYLGTFQLHDGALVFHLFEDERTSCK